MYRLDRMRRDYERFTGAEGYAIGFHVGENVYCVMLDRIPRRFTRVQKECSACGGGYGLYINVKNKKAKAELIRLYVAECVIDRLHLRPESSKVYTGQQLKYMRKHQHQLKQLTYHHIKERSQGGKATVENGALLSERKS